MSETASFPTICTRCHLAINNEITVWVGRQPYHQICVQPTRDPRDNPIARIEAEIKEAHNDLDAIYGILGDSTEPAAHQVDVLITTLEECRAENARLKVLLDAAKPYLIEAAKDGRFPHDGHWRMRAAAIVEKIDAGRL